MDEILTMGNDSDFDNDIEVVDNPRLKSSLVETRSSARVWEGQNSPQESRKAKVDHEILATVVATVMKGTQDVERQNVK